MPKGPSFLLSFVYYFSLTTMIMAFFISQELHISMLSPYPYRYGLIVGLLAGLLGGYFNHTQTVSQSFKSRRDIQTFTERLQNALQEMGFEEKGKEEDYTVYEKSRLQTFFSGKMLVQMNRKGASVSGRAINMRKLKEKLDWE